MVTTSLYIVHTPADTNQIVVVQRTEGRQLQEEGLGKWAQLVVSPRIVLRYLPRKTNVEMSR